MQGAVEKNAGVVAGKWPAGAIGAMPARSEPYDEQPVQPAAEGSDRPAVVARMQRLDGVSMARQARAQAAVGVERDPGLLYRALNCASSVEPRIAVIDELPPVTVCVTSSK